MALAAGVPGRVGEKRTPATAGAVGSNPIGAAEIDDASAAPASGTVTTGADGAGAEAVSAGFGAGLLVELQPGLAKISMSAKRWMPTTTPNTRMIFIGKIMLA
jgi:hypothetical protein